MASSSSSSSSSSLALGLVLWAACGPAAVQTPPTAGPASPNQADPTGASRPDPGSTAARPAPVSPGFRLPRDTRPVDYRVVLTVDPKITRFTGSATINTLRDAATDTIFLHAKGLTLESARYVGSGGESADLQATAVGNDMLALQPKAPGVTLPAGAGKLELAWRGAISETDSMGLFRQKTDDVWYAYTQFEPLGARRVMPCFDEPDFKVPWQLTLRVPADLVALANSPVDVERDLPGGGREVQFAVTPPLPSYLVAFTVGNFELVPAGRSKGGAAIRVAVPKGHTAEAAWPVESTAPILDALESYFGTPYPFAKLDLVPIPDTFNFGAMENPGLITYTEALLLARPDELTISDKREYAETAAHEMAHQWFGNLVTLAWWDDLWLNEAFATWTATKIMDEVKPEWHEDLVRLGEKNSATYSDSKKTTRRIREPITSEHDIEDAFDGITYSKGGAVLHMVEVWIGEDTFRDGVRRYLAKHARKSATYADLADALEAASGKPVRDVIDGFVDTTGTPLLAFRLSCEKGQKPRLGVTQSRYLPEFSTLDGARSWTVPVTVRWSAGGKGGAVTAIVTGAESTIELDAATCPDFVMPNAAGDGYYRWTLDRSGLDGLLDAKRFSALPATERYEVATTIEALVAAGDLPYRRALALAPLLLADPIRQLRRRGLWIGSGWSDDLPPKALARYRAWVKKTYGPLGKKLGFVPAKNEAEDVRLVRPGVLSRLVYDAEDAATIAEATRLAWAWLADHKKVAPELVDSVLAFAAHAGDEKLYQRFLAEARQATDKQDRERFLGALAAFEVPALVEKNLTMVLSGEFELGDTMVLVWGATERKATQALAWTFVTTHYDELVAKLPETWRAHLVRVGFDCTNEALARTQAFFAERTPKELGGPRAYDGVIEAMTLCSQTKPKRLADLLAFLGVGPA